MSQSSCRYVLIMRHAQREDEVNDGWAAAEAASEAGRPWDPPLSSPCGFAQADAAAAKLSEWEHRTGARIVTVVTSPFLRCLQTAAASCRRLGLPSMHVSWSVSEALCRASHVLPGPLPDWMWPQEERPDGSVGPAPACASGLRPEEFLTRLGATVDGDPPAAARGGGAPSQGAGSAAVANEGAAADGPQGAQQLPSAQPEEAAGLSGLLQGLLVSVLPPPVDPRAFAVAGTASSADARGPCGHCPAASLDSRPAPAASNAHLSEGEAGEVRATILSADMVRPPVATEAPKGTNAPSVESWVAGDSTCNGGHVGVQAAAGELNGCPADSRCSSIYSSSSRDSDGVVDTGPPDADHCSRGSDGQTDGAVHRRPIAAAVGTFPVPYNVPCSPETLEAAHERYRAAFKCLMAAGGTTARGERAGALNTGLAADGSPAVGCTGLAAVSGQRDPADVWRSLWTPPLRHRHAAANTGEAAEVDFPRLGVGSAVHAAAEGPRDGDGIAAHGDAQTGAVEAAGGGSGRADHVPPDSPSRGTDGAHYITCQASDPGGDEDAAGDGDAMVAQPAQIMGEAGEERLLLRQPVSQPGSPAHSTGGNMQAAGATAAAVGPAAADASGVDGGRGPSAEAVLVVTHGEAVACAVATAAPWALVYEVRHTGFVVLAARANGEEWGDRRADRALGAGMGRGGGEDGGEKGGEKGVDMVWELLPDEHGDQGVMWMSMLDD